MRFEQIVLDNGLQVIAEIHPGAHSAAVGVFVDAGSRDECGANAGVSHFLEHMAFKGTPTRSADDVNRELDEMGSHSNARTGEEQTIYHASVLPVFLPQITELFCDLMRPSLRADDFETEKKVIIEEILMYEDQPPFGGHERLMAAYFGEHPLGQSVLGTAESVTGLTPEAMRAYFEQHYAPDNIIIAAAGKVDWEPWLESIREATSTWIPSRQQRQPSKAAPNFGHEVMTKPQASQEYLLQLSPAPAAEDPDRFAARLLSTIIGDDTGSRLFWEFVDPGRAEFAGIGNYEYQGDGVAFTILGCEPEAIEENRERLERIQRGATTDTITENELERAKRKTVASLLLQSERPENRMFSIGNQWRVHERYRTSREVAQLYQAVTLADVQRIAEQYRYTDNYTLLVGPV
ncbi:MAG: insulinase family protein [Planctomycetales bacterium]|nr:insulinase family protein [Planctomycetales bacterium]